MEKPSSLTLVNGHAYSFTSSKVEMGSNTFELVTSISYEHSLEPDELRSNAAAEALADTTGQYRARASLSMYVDTWRDMRSILATEASMDGRGFMQQRFDLTVSYGEEGMPTITDKLVTCRVIKVSRPYRRGPDPLMVDVELYVRRIVEDGLLAVSQFDADSLIVADETITTLG